MFKMKYGYLYRFNSLWSMKPYCDVSRHHYRPSARSNLSHFWGGEWGHYFSVSWMPLIHGNPGGGGGGGGVPKMQLQPIFFPQYKPDNTCFCLTSWTYVFRVWSLGNYDDTILAENNLRKKWLEYLKYLWCYGQNHMSHTVKKIVKFWGRVLEKQSHKWHF